VTEKTIGGQIRTTRTDIANGEWWRRLRVGADGRQRSIKAVDLRPMSSSEQSAPSQMIGATSDGY
jgi:hypothetical protein